MGHEELTQSQYRALRCFRDFLSERGTSPTLREMAAAMDYTAVGSVQDLVKTLQKKGFLTIPDKQSSRSLRLTDKAKSLMGLAKDTITDFFQIPKLGTVPAGNPLLAFEDQLGTLQISSGMFSQRKNPDSLFALSARGDSMINAGIIEGDWLIVESTSVAEPGDIVVARLDGDATVKRLIRERGDWALKPENPRFSLITDPFEVVGKVVALYRQF